MSLGFEFPSQDQPTDGIASVAFSPTDPNLLVAACWDRVKSLLILSQTQTARVYDISKRTLVTKQTFSGPLLDACFANHSNTEFYTGGLEKTLYR